MASLRLLQRVSRQLQSVDARLFTNHRQTQRRTAARRGMAAVAAASERRVSHILLQPEQKDLMLELRKRIRAGESLASLAAEFSSCPSKSRGGDIGWVSKGRTVEEFEAAAFTAAVGEVTQATTRFGHHIMMVTEERAAGEMLLMAAERLGEVLEAAMACGEAPEGVQMIDVREEWEAGTAALPFFALRPLSRFEEWSPALKQDFDPETETIVLCHHGVRSAQLARFLVDNGFKKVWNVTGGIDAYSANVDRSVPRY